ncbi:NTE family protein [Silvibacterium bohemicum]|uniref:NTE family protein n=1 Tax=Silvibacterium bohemicum TaxID=1577686 RepID=A0A841JRJ0_9BACT|nr:patatin-like phospholipase family protein [Silvibacterium bohemicum]MBB6142399.1 NTE family protein [Silvibacterium bohemicum]
MSEIRSTAERKRALVLGGGGPVGRAWQTGLLSKFVAEGVMLRSADLIVGTSAGAISGAQLALEIEVDLTVPVPTPQRPGTPKPSGMALLIKAVAEASQSSTPEIQRRAIGRMALAAPTPSEEESIRRVNFLAQREWPENFRTTAVNVHTGESVVWHSESGVPLELAVASSCALPGVWPPVTINGDQYMDGGMRSALNANLAAGYEDVIVVSCFPLVLPPGVNDSDRVILNASLNAEIAGLMEQGAHVNLITPSAEFLKLTEYGTRMLDGSLIPESFQLGARQAIQEALRIDAAWRIFPGTWATN